MQKSPADTFRGHLLGNAHPFGERQPLTILDGTEIDRAIRGWWKHTDFGEGRTLGAELHWTNPCRERVVRHGRLCLKPRDIDKHCVAGGAGQSPGG